MPESQPAALDVEVWAVETEDDGPLGAGDGAGDGEDGADE